MKTSDTSEGDNSSLKKTFEEVVYEATPFSPGVLTVGGPAQKEDPFGDFMKSQGINVVDVTPTQKEEWEQEYITLIGTLMELSAFSAYISSFHHAKTVEFIRSQISLAEARGREATITAFEEWAGKYMTETTKYYGTDKHGIDPDDLLSFASFLKSNAPKV